MPDVHLQNLEKTLEPIFYLYKQQRRPGEALGDFATRIGFLALRTYSAGYVPQKVPVMHSQHLTLLC